MRARLPGMAGTPPAFFWLRPPGRPILATPLFVSLTFADSCAHQGGPMGARGPAPRPSSSEQPDGQPRPQGSQPPGAEADARGAVDADLADAGGEGRVAALAVTRSWSGSGCCRLVDRGALAAYCSAYAELVDATKMLEAEGRVVEVPITARKKVEGVMTVEVVSAKKALHPAVKLQRDAFGRVKQFLAEFGLTPSSRSRMRLGRGDGPPDPFEELLRPVPAGTEHPTHAYARSVVAGEVVAGKPGAARVRAAPAATWRRARAGCGSTRPPPTWRSTSSAFCAIARAGGPARRSRSSPGSCS